MTEIWNLGALCRCCHLDGQFKSLNRTYVVNNDVEIYSSMLRDTFGIIINPPATPDISYTICDRCIEDLRRATNFKKQVLICESKFEEYCKNEEFFKVNDEIKAEIESLSDSADREDFNDTNYNDAEDDKKITELEIKDEYKIDVKVGSAVIKGEGDVKDELEDKTIEVTIDFVKAETKDSKTKKTKKTRTDTKRLELDEEHLKLIVKKENSYFCEACDCKFKNESSLKKHILRKHVGKLYKCKFCDEEFEKQTDKVTHMAKHDPKKPYTCTYCGKICPTKYKFKTHLNRHTKSQIFECDHCKKHFLYKKSLLIHIKLFHLKLAKPMICDVCGRFFNDVTNLRKHVESVHEKLRPYKCEYCSKDFTAKKHVVLHVRRHHTGEKPYICDLCDASFFCSTDLFKHKSKIHEGKITTYTCKFCNIQYSSRGELLIHSRQHDGFKPLFCSICNANFMCKYSLRRHIESHTGVKKFQCTICLKKFQQKGGLSNHIKKLHSEKPVVEKKKCHICKKHVANLEKHIDAHNNKPHGCNYCPKRYPEKNALNRHIANIHFGRKAHVCDICDHKYVHPRSLINHKLKVHKIVSKIEKEEEVLDDYMSTLKVNNEAAANNV